MKRFLLIGAGIAVLASSGAAYAQMPPGGPQGGPGAETNGPEMHERWAMMRHMRHDEGAAFFRFRRGDAEMDIKCPANEQVQACVAAAGTLMDKVAGMQQPKQP